MLFRLNDQVAPNVALERLAHATTNKGHSPASPLQALVRWRGGYGRSFTIQARPSKLGYISNSSSSTRTTIGRLSSHPQLAFLTATLAATRKAFSLLPSSECTRAKP